MHIYIGDHQGGYPATQETGDREWPHCIPVWVEWPNCTPP